MPKTKLFPKPTRLLSKSHLLTTWRASRDSKSASGGPGIDGQTARGFGNSLDDNVTNLVRNLARGEFGFSGLRPHLIPKGNSDQFRLICVPTVRDRLVQRAIAARLTEHDRLHLENANSFGFVRGKSAKDAVKQALNLRASHDYVFETDITAFFDQIDRNLLKATIRRSLRQSSLVPFLERAIDCEVRPRNSAEAVRIAKTGINSGRGLRQGMPLSPLLANLVLRSFDQCLIENGVKAVRYADDIVTFAKTRNEANAHIDLIVSALAQIRHTVPAIELDTKTRIVNRREKFEFLGREFYFSNKYGDYAQRVSEHKVEKIVLEIEKFGNIESLIENNISFADHATRLWRTTQSYIHTYSDASNATFVENKVMSASNLCRRRIFEQMFGRTAVTHLSKVHQEFLGIRKNEVGSVEWDDFEDF